MSTGAMESYVLCVHVGMPTGAKGFLQRPLDSRFPRCGLAADITVALSARAYAAWVLTKVISSST
jgi:hypothetical protein